MAVKSNANQDEGPQVGKRVGIRFGNTILAGTVVENRGRLGPYGEPLIRVSVHASPSTTTTFEVLFSTLLPTPAAKPKGKAKALRPSRKKTGGRAKRIKSPRTTS